MRLRRYFEDHAHIIQLGRLTCLLLITSTSMSNERSSAQLCGQLAGVNISENFNTLAASGSSTVVPSGFNFIEAGAGGTLTYSADNGNNSAADTYSYGTTGSTDRAFGEITSSSSQTTIGACFVNNTNHPISSFLVGYTGEEWRLAATGTVDRLDFQYSVDADSLISGTYIDVDALDFNTPDNVTPGPKNGNMAHTIILPFAVTPADPIQPERVFYIRWRPLLIAGTNTNDGLAIDDFIIGAVYAPGLAGDYNNNGVVDAADYTVWRDHLNAPFNMANDITPGTVIQQDLQEWKDRFGKNSVSFGAGAPEPATWLLLGSSSIALVLKRRSLLALA
jgi:hypothetical protein